MKLLVFILSLAIINIPVCLSQGKKVLQISSYTVDDGLSHRVISNIIQDSKGYIWMATWNGLCRYDASRFETWNMLPNGSTIGRLLRIAETEDGHIYCHNYNDSVYIFDPVTCRFMQCTGAEQLISYPPNPYLLQVEQGGLLIIHRDSGERYFLPVKSNKRLKNTLHASFFDRQGNFWVNFDDVLYKLSFSPEFYTYRTHIKTENSLLFGDEIRAIACSAKSGRLWIGAKSGDIYVYSKEGDFEGYLSKNGSVTQVPVHFGANAYVIKEDRSGRIWIGTKGDGLYSLVPEGDKKYTVSHYTQKSHGLADDRIYSLFFDDLDRLWIGTFGNGFSIVSVRGNSVNLLKNGLSGQRIRCIGPFEAGLICASTNGLYLVDSSGRVLQKIGNSDFTFVHKSNRGDIYVSTIGAGIFRLCSESGHWQLIPVRLGNVSYDVVLSIAEELSGNIWFVSDNSLVRLFTDGNIQTFNQDFFGKNITFSEGIPMLKDNKLFLGTADGFIEMSLESSEKFLPPLYWRYIQVEDSLIVPTDSLLTVRLGEHVRISPVALDYRPGTIRYSYRLDADTVWRDLDYGKVIELDNLSEGSHVLTVRSTDSYGMWMNNDRAFIIDVRSSFYKGVVWFIVIGLLVVVSIFLFYNRLPFVSRNSLPDISPSLPKVDFSPDEQFLEAAKLFVESNMDKPELSVGDFAAYMGMSRTILYNRMKDLLDKTPANFIKEMRIKRAVQLLKLNIYTVSEIADMTGFNDAKYFSKVFKREIGVSPMSYVDEQERTKN